MADFADNNTRKAALSVVWMMTAYGLPSVRHVLQPVLPICQAK